MSFLSDTRGGVFGTTATIILILLFVIFVLFVDVMTCPVCRDIPIVKKLCPACDGDGHVSIWQYIMLQQGGSAQALGFEAIFAVIGLLAVAYLMRWKK